MLHTFLAIWYDRETRKIKKSLTTVVQRGKHTLNTRFHIDRDIRNNQRITAEYVGHELIVLRKDFAKYYIEQHEIGELYLDQKMIDWYPPGARGRKPTTFFSREAPIKADQANVDYCECPKCGHQYQIKRRRKKKQKI